MVPALAPSVAQAANGTVNPPDGDQAMNTRQPKASIRITGRIVNLRGTALSRQEFTAQVLDSSDAAIYTKTDGAGRFDFRVAAGLPFEIRITMMMGFETAIIPIPSGQGDTVDLGSIVLKPEGRSRAGRRVLPRFSCADSVVDSPCISKLLIDFEADPLEHGFRTGRFVERGTQHQAPTFLIFVVAPVIAQTFYAIHLQTGGLCAGIED